MGQTRYYGLAYFDFGDQLDTRINVQKEIDRFVVVDKQIYGLYKVFGNGVIEGWTVANEGSQGEQGISVSVSQGIGVINYVAAETTLPGFIRNLPINSLVDIYAVLSGSTYLDRSINFIYSGDAITSLNAIRIARVSTGANGILYIDNDVRDLIGFEEIIQDAINEHKHRGTPSKIDLANEVRNQLPGARLEGIDASKITSGQFDIDRIPLVDHNDLDNNGLLTHAALDSFVQTLSQNNKELLGEISSVNLLKLILFWKYNYTDVDEHFINELALIPGISPDSFIDFNASKANISLIDHCISGIPSQSGIFTSIYWDDTFSFNTANFKNNVVIENDTVVLDRSDQSDEIIDNFTAENSLDDWKHETLIISDSTAAIIATEETNRFGRLTSGSEENYFFRKNWSYPDGAKKWDGKYDELVIKVKTIDQIHGPVYMYVVNGSNQSSSTDPNRIFGDIETGDITGTQLPSASWTLLAQDENMSDFTEKVFDISSLGLDDVSQITIYTADENLVFDIDDIIVRRTNLVSSTGTIRFRYSTESSVVFHSIFYDADTPEDTEISVRVHTSNSEEGLLRSSYSMSLNSGDVMALPGSYSEIEVVMNSNDLQTLSPVLNSLELRILVDASFTGFVIDTEVEWDRGTLSNVTTNDSVEDGKSHLTVSTPINVGGRYFSKANSISEVNDEDISVSGTGFSGSLMPIAPGQAREWGPNSGRGFSVASSVVRQFDNSFLISDLNNNRVMKVDNAGNLIKGFGSTYSVDTSNFYPLSAIYNPIDKILTIVFTKPVTVADLTQIYFTIGASSIYLTASDIVLNNNKAANKVLEVQLDDDTAVRLVTASSNLGVNFDSGAFTDTLSIPTGMTSSNNAIYNAISGFVCFVGDFTYIDNISHPVFVKETISGNWIIGNSSIFYGEIDPDKEQERTVPDIIEIDPEDVSNTDNKLISNDIKFSDYSLGNIFEYANNRFIVAGIAESNTSLSSITGDDLRAKYDPVPESIEFRASAIDDLNGYVGSVVILDKINSRVQVLYSSPDGLFASSIDGYDNGDFVISESSFADASGRIIRIDGFGNILRNYGQGTFAVINSVNALNDNSLIVSV